MKRSEMISKIETLVWKELQSAERIYLKDCNNLPQLNSLLTMNNTVRLGLLTMSGIQRRPSYDPIEQTKWVR
jgi:hypothetical protein